MKPARFDYADPTTLGEVIALLRQHDGEAKLLAGGQSLMPMLSMRLARPGLLIDVNRIPGLDYIRETDGVLAIGTMARKRAVEDSDLVARRNPLVRAATLLVGHQQIRNRGTVGGSMAQADPAAEYPALAVALDADLRATGPGGERTIRAADFFVTFLTTALEPAEVLTEVRFPVLPARTGWSVLEVARRHGDFAIAGAVTTLTLDGGGRVGAARIVLFGVGSTPLRARQAEDRLVGQVPGEKLFAEAAAAVDQAIDEPMSDVHATAEYRRHVAQVLTRRALAESATRARGEVL
ncbi:MAG: xanthine dehydrogenase family protein subunit M [Candidatus Binatia bacterium]